MEGKISKFTFILLMFFACVFAYSDDDFTYDEQDEILDRVEREAFDGKKFRILIQVVKPYVFVNESVEEGRIERYYGYIPDIIAKMAKRMEFTYVFKTVPGDDVTVKEFADSNEYDIYAAPITVTGERASKVDFAKPFQHVQLTAVIQKPHIKAHEEKKEGKKEADKKGEDYTNPHHYEYSYNVFRPFAPETWGVTTLMIVLVWFVMWIMNKYNPYEHGWRYDNGLGSEDNSKLFNTSGAFWFVGSTLQWQGYDRRPRSWANSIMGCFWMCFVLLTLVSYIGSAVNHMFWSDAVRRHYHAKNPLHDLQDLVDHKDDYQYGTIKGSAMQDLLSDVARGPINGKMKKYFESDHGKEQLVSSVKEGLKKARKERYAFILEEPVAKYWQSREPCDLLQTDIKFGMRSYAFALKKDSEYTNAFSKATLGLIEDGYMEKLERWFEPDAMCKIAEAFHRDARHKRSWLLQNPGRVDMHIYWSVILFIVIGVAISSIVAAMEIFWFRYKGRYRATYEHRDNWTPDVDN